MCLPLQNMHYPFLTHIVVLIDTDYRFMRRKPSNDTLICFIRGIWYELCSMTYLYVSFETQYRLNQFRVVCLVVVLEKECIV